MLSAQSYVEAVAPRVDDVRARRDGTPQLWEPQMAGVPKLLQGGIYYGFDVEDRLIVWFSEPVLSFEVRHVYDVGARMWRLETPDLGP